MQRNHQDKRKGANAPKRRKWIAAIIVAALIFSVIGFSVKNRTAQVELAGNTVEIEPVQYRNLSDFISIRGTLSGESRTNVVSLATAEVTAVNVQVGDMVATGDLLATLDQADIDKQIAEIQRSITNAEAIAGNQESQIRRGLDEAKEDQAGALAKASEAVTRAQAEYEELKRKSGECAARLSDKGNELLFAGQTSLDCKNAYDTAAAEYRRLEAELWADQGNAALEASLRQAEAVLKEKEAAYKTAAEEYGRIEGEWNALKVQADSYEEALKTAKEAVSSAESGYDETVTATNRSVASARNQVEMSKYQSNDSAALYDKLEELNRMRSDCSLTAPCGGVITAVNVSVGDKYAAGQTMITIEDTSKMKVVVTVEEADILKIEEGMSAVITTDATGDKEINGVVTRVVRVKNQSEGIAGQSAAGGYLAEISIGDTGLFVGMSAKAKIILREKEHVLAAPYDLIRYDENGDAYVLVAEPDEGGMARAVRKNIVVGEEVGYYTEVLGGELKEGDRMIYDYTGSIVPGQQFMPEQLYSEQEMESEDTGAEAKQ